MGNKEEMEKEYVAAYVPDMPKIIEYVKRAKGPNRTMAQFAEVLSAEENVSVSASTLSRIVNNNKAKPLSVELIKAMVKNAADPEDISFYAFMRANGMIPREEQEDRENRLREIGIASTDHRTEYENEKRNIRNIIGDELNARGYMMMFLPVIPREDNRDSRFFLGKYACSFAARVHGVEPKYWSFHVYRSFQRPDGKPHLQFDLNRAMRVWDLIFLKDLWEPELFGETKIKNTFLFTDSEAFELFCDKLQDITVNTNMSAMLIDLQKQEIVSEIPFKRRDGKVFESLLDNPKVKFDSFDDEDVEYD